MQAGAVMRFPMAVTAPVFGNIFMVYRIIMRGERQREHAINLLHALKIDRPMEIIIKPYKKNRSLDQNALYWKWLTIMGDSMGYTKDEMHEEMMRQHLPPDLIQTPGGIVEVFTTKNKNVKVMSEYMTSIDITAGKMGIHLPSSEPE